MINANNNACFETPVTAVTFSTEKLLFINNSSKLLRPPRKIPLYKATPESLSNWLLFDIPASPRNFRCPPWGLWIFSATTHYTYQREAVEWKKSFKILQAKEPCYENDKQSSHWLLIQLTVLLIFVTIISPGQRSCYTVFFCRNKMLRKGDDTCPVESCIGFQPRRPYEKAWQGWKELITFQILVGSTHKPQ